MPGIKFPAITSDNFVLYHILKAVFRYSCDLFHLSLHHSLVITNVIIALKGKASVNNV
jgi:hypothetical protein